MSDLSESALKCLSGHGPLGIVLSGGGSRAAYQVGVLKALAQNLEESRGDISVIIGASIGSVNGVLFGGLLQTMKPAEAVKVLEAVWIERTFRNTFRGRPSNAFFRAIKVAFLKYSSPTPDMTSAFIFDPAPLMERIDGILDEQGGLTLTDRPTTLHAVGVMTTVEGSKRKPLLIATAKQALTANDLQGAIYDIRYVPKLGAKHALASAALPSVLPPVELDIEESNVRLVDGGISENIPVDPAVRFGCERIISIDISGRTWWHDRYGRSHDTREDWEVDPINESFCLRPPLTFTARNVEGLGKTLRAAVAGSASDFISALGPTWPIYRILKSKLGEELAYEVMSYVALHPDYTRALIEKGYKDTLSRIEELNQFSPKQKLETSPELG
ncbi:patatin-like phospholipase family protein [bacterium]|nr:patatin-like phospholipase family protein [bacterium]